MVTAEGETGPAMRFFEKRPPSVMVCFAAAAEASAAASSSAVAGTTLFFGDKTLLYAPERPGAKKSYGISYGSVAVIVLYQVDFDM
jgi:hypothetical protein